MEHIYALGVILIEFIQYWFQDWAWHLEWVNDFSNPHMLMQFIFPLISVVDSVFAAQLLLALGFGGWLNTVLKWLLQEDRPYWWVKETSFYTTQRPRLKQTRQTCETGPGSPSGHSGAGATALILLLMIISHTMRDRKVYFRHWKYVMYPLCGATMAAIVLARMFVAAHFPHQCILGAILGAFIAPGVCIYVSDPYIWRYGPHASIEPSTAMVWHVVSVFAAAAIAAITYGCLWFSGLDPMWTVKLACRSCNRPEDITVCTTPLAALVECSASLLGWALAVTPAVAEYRHYTPHRSLIIASFSTGVIMYGLHHISEYIEKADNFKYYASHFLLSAIKPPLFLRLTPSLAMWPYSRKEKYE